MKKQIFIGVIVLSLIIPILSSAKADVAQTENKGIKIENREQKMENIMVRASTTQLQLENRENIMERIRARIASSTASTSGKKMEQYNVRLQKQYEQRERARERLLGKETKIIETIGKIADKIAERINILEAKGLDMAVASAKLIEADTKIAELTNEANDLSSLLETEITEENKETLFQEIRASQVIIRDLARATHALLVDTIKEITKVLPKNN